MRQRTKDSGNGGVPEGRYANYFEIGHNAFEFLMDFGQLYDDEPQSRMHSRIVVSPFYARGLLEILSQAVRQYEQSYGRIPGEADETEGTGRIDNVRPIQAVKLP
jgi:hypothetical protein